MLAVTIAVCTVARAMRPALGDVPLEQQVKSAFVVNFVQFVDWPSAAFDRTADPLVIGVVDPDVVEALSAAVAGKTFKGRKLVIRQYSPTALGKCQVLVTGGLDGWELDAALKQAAKTGTLTIGDVGRFTDAGGIIMFYMEDRKVRFEINQAAAARAGLQISSQLLKLARVVNK